MRYIEAILKTNVRDKFVTPKKCKENDFRVCLIGEVEKWKKRKWENDRKVGGWKRFSFLLHVFGWEDRKMKKWKTHLFVWEKNEMMKNVIQINLL